MAVSHRDATPHTSNDAVHHVPGRRLEKQLGRDLLAGQPAHHQRYQKAPRVCTGPGIQVSPGKHRFRHHRKDCMNRERTGSRNRLRRMSVRQGLVLEKCRRRDPRAIGMARSGSSATCTGSRCGWIARLSRLAAAATG
jgi:hypothetical protein